LEGQGKAKKPCAIAVRNGYPSRDWRAMGELENLASGDWIRTFAIITTDANELVAEIHDRICSFHERA